MTPSPQESLRRFVKQRLTAAAQQIFSIFQQNLLQCQDEMQRQRQLLDVIPKPDCRAEPQQRPGVLEEVEGWRPGLEPMAGVHCDVGEEFVEQRICAAADDLWSLLESLFAGREAESEGRGAGGPRPVTEPPLLPVCKEEEEERSCSLTPHVKEEEEEQDFGSTQDVEQQQQQKEEEEDEEGGGTLGSTPSSQDGEHRELHSDQRSWSHLQTGSEVTVLMSERQPLTSNLCSNTELRTHHDSQNRFVDEELRAAVDDIFTVIERFLCTSTEKREHQRPLLDLDGNSHQSRTVRSQKKKKSGVGRRTTQALWVKEEKVEKELHSSQIEEQLLLKQEEVEKEPHSPRPSSSENSGGSGSCSQTGRGGTRSRPPAAQRGTAFKCETCGKTSRRRYLHLQHIRTHTGEKPHTCETCGNSFNQKSALNQHMRTHTGEKPFLCKTCGRSFGQASSLRAHRITHSDQQPHECRFCGMTFALLERLVRHTRVHTDERPYACQVCGRSFRQSTSLSVHLRVHSGERPYRCGFCGKGFVDKSGVNAHQKIHLGEKAHRCRTCGKFFRSSNQLKIHTRVHSGEKPFTCQRWGRRFNQRASLQKHRETHGDHMCS